MKICVLTHTYPRFPGDTNAPFVRNLSLQIAQRGHHVSVITSFDPAFDIRSLDRHIRLFLYRYIWPDRFHILGYSRTIEGNIRFRKRMLLLSPFLFFFGFIKTLSVARSIKADILHAHWILPNGFIGALVSRILGIPLVITLHGSDVFTAEKNPLFSLMARIAGRCALWMTTPSPDHFKRLRRIGVRTDRLEMVPNGTDPVEFQPDPKTRAEIRKSLGIQDDSILVFALGRMVYVKGFDVLLRAYARVIQQNNTIHLVIAGEGAQKEEWMTLAQNLGLKDRVVWPGALDRSQVAQFLSASDIFVVPSVQHPSGAVDGLPVVIPEAMSSALPIIGSDVGGIPVVVQDGISGIIVPQRDETSLAEAILKLAHDSALRQSLGEKGRCFVLEKLTWKNLAEHFEDIFCSLSSGLTTPSSFYMDKETDG